MQLQSLCANIYFNITLDYGEFTILVKFSRYLELGVLLHLSASGLLLNNVYLIHLVHLRIM